MTIAVDVDDVTVDFTGPFLDNYNTECNTHWTANQLTSHNFYQAGLFTSQDACREAVLAFSRDHLFQLPLVRNARLALRHLSKKFDIIFVTSRSEEFREVTERALAEHGFNPTAFPVYHSTREHTKAYVLEEHGARWLIDDSPKYINEVLTTVRRCNVIYFNAIPAAELQVNEKAWIADTWLDALTIIGA